MSGIKDVAKRAGVSISTVSHVMNGTKYVSEVTTQKVKEAIRELGYEADSVARSMKSNKTKKIGIVTNDMCGLFYPYIIKAICTIAESKGYNVIVCDTADDLDREKKCLHTLVSSRVDGIILSSSIPEEDKTEYAKELLDLVTRQKDIALVCIERDFTPYGIDSVYSDIYDGAIKATEHLIHCGCRSIAHITGPISAFIVQKRVDGYKKALMQNGLPLQSSLIAHGDYTHLSGYLAMKSLLKLDQNLDGVFIANDQMAIGACRALKEASIQIPEQIKVIGFDDVFISNMVDPPLSTIHIMKKRLGQEAIQLLLNRLHNNNPERPVSIELPNHLVIRRSTDPSIPDNWGQTDW